MFVVRIIPDTKIHNLGRIQISLILKQVVHVAISVFGSFIKHTVFE